MKRILVVILVCLGLSACKKDSGGAPTVLLTEIKSDALIEYRFHYGPDNLVVKLENYKTDPADNSLLTYIEFVYDPDGNIKQLTAYSSPGNLPVSKAVLQYDSTGKLVSADTYDLQGLSPNNPKYFTKYKYNTKGRVSNIQQRDKNDDLVDYINLLYYDDGHLKEQQQWAESGAGLLYMTHKTSFSVPAGYYPSGLEQLEVLLSVDFIGAMYSESINYLSYDQSGFITYNRSDLMSAREYNDDGSLKKQAVTRKFVKPEKDDVSFLREYTYVIK